MTLAHGTVQRYAHGCDCPDCEHAHVKQQRTQDQIRGRVQTVRKDAAASETFRIALDTYTDNHNRDWQQDAACRGSDPALFFPERGDPTREAKAICASCPVRRECLDEAVAAAIQDGIWGGKSPRERRRIRVGKQVA